MKEEASWRVFGTPTHFYKCGKMSLNILKWISTLGVEIL
jgi:hypothetical protein